MQRPFCNRRHGERLVILPVWLSISTKNGSLSLFEMGGRFRRSSNAPIALRVADLWREPQEAQLNTDR